MMRKAAGAGRCAFEIDFFTATSTTVQKKKKGKASPIWKILPEALCIRLIRLHKLNKATVTKYNFPIER